MIFKIIVVVIMLSIASDIYQIRKSMREENEQKK